MCEYHSVKEGGIYTIESAIINGNTRYSETLKRADERLVELTLINLDNRVAYAVSDLSNAEITMDGLHTRTFRWVLGTVDDSTFTPLVAPLSAKSATFRQSPSQAFQTVPKTVTKFGLPPQ